ncbi:MAG: cobalamin biosynthesis protein CobQ [Marinibacterium sp.]|nr:cobalamin biosynthesis protein CobQ [Marinibacterium sp.]
MNTPAHMLLGAAVFGRDRRRMGAAVLGALAPDASLYLLAGWALWIRQIPAQVVFDELYFSPGWQQIFAIDNAIPLWLAGLGLAWWCGSGWWIAFAGAGLLHLVLDLPLHAGDGRAHFWPFSTWVFDSPVSYWDSTHHAAIVAPVSIMVSLLAFVVIWRRHPGGVALVGFVLLLGAEIWVARQWLLFF